MARYVSNFFIYLATFEQHLNIFFEQLSSTIYEGLTAGNFYPTATRDDPKSASLGRVKLIEILRIVILAIPLIR